MISPRFPFDIRPGVRSSVISLLLCCVGEVANAAPEAVSCGDDTTDSAVLKTASHGAQRSSPRVLTVNYQGGVKRFEDQPPYQEAFGGAHWYYCGYVPSLRAHLIGKNEKDLFSGVLLLDDSGQLVNAGQTVHPSPDGKWFLAERQQNNEQDSQWLVAERSGKTLSDGYATVYRMVREKPGGKPVEQVAVWYKLPYWTEGGALRATAVCNPPEVEGVANFVLLDGAWRWQTDLRCMPNAAGGR